MADWAASGGRLAEIIDKTAVAKARAWFPPLFFGAVALGTLPVIFTNLFVPSAQVFDSVAAIEGREYAEVQLPAFDRNPLLIHAHAAIGFLLVVTAPFQFWKSFRIRHLKLHRIMGYIAMACLSVLAISGLAVAIVYPFAGAAGAIPNFIWMSAILFSLVMAYRNIRARNVLAHETWMTRAMAMTLGITFASLYLPFLNNVLHLPSRTALAVSFWLGVIECLLVGEVWLNRPGRPKPRKR